MADYKLFKLSESLKFGMGAHRVVDAVTFYLACRDVDVFPVDRCAYIVRGEPAGAQGFAIEPDADISFL